jgi:hypothetical protein
MDRIAISGKSGVANALAIAASGAGDFSLHIWVFPPEIAITRTPGSRRRHRGGHVWLSVSDRGRGFDPKEPGCTGGARVVFRLSTVTGESYVILCPKHRHLRSQRP